MASSGTRTLVRGRIGELVLRPDGVPKVTGAFQFASDLSREGMAWGVTVRSPHAHARIAAIDVSEAAALHGVLAVLTHADVPGRKTYGMEHHDQPVLAWDEVRYEGEPVVIVAAVDLETARLAAARVRVHYEELPVVTWDDGIVLRHVPIRHGDQEVSAEVVVSGTYEVGMQDQAFLGPESGLAIPAEDGGIDLHVATQWLHVDQEQVAASTGLTLEQTRLHLAGVGGAFGGREDVSMQIHASLLALRSGRPVKMVYTREESFYGHVHRHPARMRYEHGATRDGRLVYVKADVLLDGGAYASSSPAVVSNAATFAVGPYRVESATIDATVTLTNNPPCGAMRGFGAVQVAFAHEAQMDRLAAALGIDPVDLRIANALTTGDRMITGQLVEGPAPVAELLERLRAMPLPPDTAMLPSDQRDLPGGLANVTHGEGVRRGVGYAIGFKNIGFSEGFDDYATARVRVSLVDGAPRVEVHTAACEVGQGLVTVLAQIARTELEIADVVVLQADTLVGSAGSTSASRQTWMTGGAVRLACEAVRARLHELSPERHVEETAEHHHRPTVPLDPVTGQGDSVVALAFAAHRAVADVDCELGLVRVVEIATSQDVGRIINPIQCEGQIQGGIAQGLGLAVMEEIQLGAGRIRNASFTDYLIPTVLDMPTVRLDILETPHPLAPYGLNGVGEPPTIASTPAVVAALRDASGIALARVPVRPEDLTTSSSSVSSS